jgi:hypothetical protein
MWKKINQLGTASFTDKSITMVGDARTGKRFIQHGEPALWSPSTLSEVTHFFEVPKVPKMSGFELWLEDQKDIQGCHFLNRDHLRRAFEAGQSYAKQNRVD